MKKCASDIDWGSLIKEVLGGSILMENLDSN